MAEVAKRLEPQRTAPRSGTFLKQAGRETNEYRFVCEQLEVLKLSTAIATELELMRLRSMLAMLFAREESPGGLFDTIAQCAYGLRFRSEEMRRDHTHILWLFDLTLLRAARAQHEIPADALRAFEDLKRTLGRHEAREQALLQDALQTDIPAL